MDRDIAARILEALDDAKRWRARMEANFNLLSQQVAEVTKEVEVRAENADQRHRETSARLRDAEAALRAAGAGAVDVNISQGNQTVGAEPAATATRSSLPKAAAAVGGSGFFGWLAGGGWDQISAFFKKLGG
ncbi:hypothetical protein CHR90_02325 [Elstera cyanobacteriorum]|uniref:Uncharacterized protein n=2 Tax=Elstera cyanobacteriorum TaxID=2022747 RepID=A0A255XWG4_9PROT|nr:hypothetical protein CHR90_02280 [Elstera cyanobacteriorum]OYQ21337.1 hypothetical protein CHR90_02325 [Elstera cyanobacteriorum]